jgi:ankyrin repeat protein
VDIVMLLLQHGAAVDATTKDLYTPLHIAAKEGQEEVSVCVYSISYGTLTLEFV